MDAVNAVIDAIESWITGLSFWAQAPLLLLVLVPFCWLLAGGIDQLVERLLRRNTRRETLRSASVDRAAASK